MKKLFFTLLIFVFITGIIAPGSYADPPSPPTNLRINAVGVDWMHLAWEDNAVDETGFKIEQSSDGVTFSEVGTAASDIKAYLATGLTAGTTYYYRVIGFNGDGDSGASNTDFAQTDSLWTAQDYDLDGDGITKRQEIINEYNITAANTYYLDASNIDDPLADGTLAHPWYELIQAQNGTTSIGENCIVLVRDGKYGSFTDTRVHANKVIYMNQNGHTPVFNNISIECFPSSAALNLIFYGIKIAPSWVDPASSGNVGADDPQYAESDLNTYQECVGLGVVRLYRCSFVEFYNCEIAGTNKHLSGNSFYLGGIDVVNRTGDIVVERCHIHKVNSGVACINSDRVSLRYNLIHEMTSSMFRVGANSSDVLIEGNHAYDSNWNFLEDYCPRAQNQTYHGSMIAIGTNNITIRNNILHDGCNTSGIAFYTPDASGGEDVYSNILIENNLVYDAHNSVAVQVVNLGENVVFRNNIVVGRGRFNHAYDYRYLGAFTIYSVANGYDGSGLSLYNNIFVGRVDFTGDLFDSNGEPIGVMDINNITENNNIFFAVDSNTGGLSEESNSIVAYPGNYQYFETEFFSVPLDVSWYNWESGDDWPYRDSNGDGTPDFIDDPYRLNPPAGYKDPANYTFARNSPGINFGDPNTQYPIALAGIDENGFIIPDGVARDTNRHSAGCYEYRSILSGAIYLLLF